MIVIFSWFLVTLLRFPNWGLSIHWTNMASLIGLKVDYKHVWLLSPNNFMFLSLLPPRSVTYSHFVCVNFNHKDICFPSHLFTFLNNFVFLPLSPSQQAFQQFFAFVVVIRRRRFQAIHCCCSSSSMTFPSSSSCIPCSLHSLPPFAFTLWIRGGNNGGNSHFTFIC